MSDYVRLHREDDPVTRGLRELHAPPAAESYWSELEARIMARIAEAEPAWWSELGRWARPALVAAAVLVIAAGVLVFRTREEATQIAYEDVLAAPTPISLEGTARPASLRGLHGEREETLRFLITY
ncbi:MAG: hypothetical protein ABR499_22575 [Gemmatimonadaceae bacterium]